MEFQKDFSSNKTVYMADLLVTDWSSIAFEYAFSTLKPVLFINTPMKIVNEEYKELTTVPIDIELRDKIGISVDPQKIPEEIAGNVERLLYNEQFAPEAILKLKNEYIYHPMESGKVGAQYLIAQLVECSKKKEYK